MPFCEVAAWEVAACELAACAAAACGVPLVAVTLAEVLELPELQVGRPVVHASEAALRREVRWVHVAEIADIAPLLHGGELLLTTGLGMPATDLGLRRYVDALAAVGITALVVELGTRFPELPGPLLAAAAGRDLAVVGLRRAVKFVAVTEAAHALILNAQYRLLQASERAHQEFTRLSLEGASLQDVLDKVAELSGRAVVLEDLAHRPLLHSGGTADLLDGWPARSRTAESGGATALAGPEGWLVTPVGPRRARWGRLVMPDPDGSPAATTLLERGAEAVALTRLVERDRAGLERLAHRGLLGDLLEGRVRDGLDSRARALGLPTARRRFVGIDVRAVAATADPVTTEARDRTLAEAALSSVTRSGGAALVAPWQPARVMVLASVPEHRDLTAWLRAVADRVSLAAAAWEWCRRTVVGVGAAVSDLSDAAASLTEAGSVADIAVAMRGVKPMPYYVSTDVRLQGLLLALRDDPRVLAFAEAELGSLLRHDAVHGTQLVRTLEEVLRRASKAEAAEALHLSRPALYARLDRIAAVSGADLDDPDSRLALQVALVVRSVTEPGGRTP